MNPTCPLCNQELGPLEIECHQTTHYDCRVCTYCKAPVAEQLLEKALTESRLPYHEPCHETKMMADFRDNDIPLMQKHLDVLNKWILMKRPIAENPPLEWYYTLLRDLQQAAVNVSIAIKRQKDKIVIADAEQYRAHVEIASENAKQSKRVEEEKKIRLQAERDNPALRARRKAVEGMIALGVSKEVAESMIPQVGETKQ